MSFGIVTYHDGRSLRSGVLVDERVIDATSALAAVAAPPVSMLDVLEHWSEALPLLEELADELSEALDAGELRSSIAANTLDLRAPLPRPVNIYCAFANYIDHMREMGGQPADKTVEDPYLFMVPVTAVCGPGDDIVIPPGITRTDWEGELAAVIGQPARELTLDNALGCVAGYTILHDVSIRGGARRGDNEGRPDWVAGKGRRSFKPMGPALVPAKFIPDPQVLSLRTWVNNQLKQDSNTNQMIFTLAEQLVFLSRCAGLVPGDVIATGTPAGVGMPKGTFLKPGDRVTIEIEGLGRLTNPVAAGS